jgi:hypothetical protein
MGMTREAVVSLLGLPIQPPEPLHDMLEEFAPLDENTDYFERGRQFGADEDSRSNCAVYDVTNSALAAFRGDILITLVIWKVSTC